MSASWMFRLVCFVVISALVLGNIPEGYVMEVDPKCGVDATTDAIIHIITDLDAKATAVCADNVKADFTTKDNVNFYLPVSYPGKGSNICKFVKRKHSLVFAIRIKFSFGEPGNRAFLNKKEFTVTCTYGKKGVDTSADNPIMEGLIAPSEIAKHGGTDSLSTFSVELVDVLGRPFNTSVALGRRVRLKGRTKAEGGELGLRPVSCFAIDGDARYAILRAGCGDGIVFGKDEGFMTKGRETFSPFFTAFSLNDGVVVKFECHFVTCAFSCDGCSCEAAVSSTPTDAPTTSPAQP